MAVARGPDRTRSLSRLKKPSREFLLFANLLGVFLLGFYAGLSRNGIDDVGRAQSSLLTYYPGNGNPENLVSSQSVGAELPGWKTMHVFYGAADIMPTAASPQERAKPWHSQVYQDETVFRMLREKRNGYFIDLAANDPVLLSNSYSLETQHDWQGLCIEGNPYLLDALSYRKCEVIGAVISQNRMEQISYTTRLSSAYESALGGIVGEEFDNKKTNEGDRAITKYTVSLLEIFQRFQVPRHIDYFSLDVEGAESMVFSSFPLDLYSFKILTIERPRPDVVKLLQSKGYVCLTNLKRFGETIWARRDNFSEMDLSVVGLSQQAASVPGFCGCSSKYSNSCLLTTRP